MLHFKQFTVKPHAHIETRKKFYNQYLGYVIRWILQYYVEIGKVLFSCADLAVPPFEVCIANN